MYYFIPAWYGQTDEFWKTAIDPWYRIRQKIEFDDSLHQVRIFQDEDLAPQLLLLAYQPHLRRSRHDPYRPGWLSDRRGSVSVCRWYWNDGENERPPSAALRPHGALQTL